jgi:membrane-bound lytic murein transglycosylase B
MITRPKHPLHVLAIVLIGLFSATAQAERQDFATWLDGVRQEAMTRGVTQATLDKALRLDHPIEKVIELDQRQPEFVDTFWSYLDKRINTDRIRKGRELLEKHKRLLASVENCHHVPPRFLVSFWAMETNFGQYTGGFPVIPALATLAHDGRRADFFREELLTALEIVQEGHIDASAMTGSWAGAMGQMQFMPTTFQHYAVDIDGDHRADIWHSVADAFGSAANYLNQIGWRDDEIWGREVRLPDNFDWRLTGLETKKSVNAWANLGVTQADGTPLPFSSSQGAVILPQGHAGPAFLVYRNFETIMAWNRSINYALSVALLADRFRGMPSLRLGRQADNRRMTRDDAMELQTRLNTLGFDAGKADGVIGTRGRQAVRAYQQATDLPADGYASMTLLEHLRARDSAPVARPDGRGAPGSDAGGTRHVATETTRDG